MQSCPAGYCYLQWYYELGFSRDCILAKIHSFGSYPSVNVILEDLYLHCGDFDGKISVPKSNFGILHLDLTCDLDEFADVYSSLHKSDILIGADLGFSSDVYLGTLVREGFDTHTIGRAVVSESLRTNAAFKNGVADALLQKTATDLSTRNKFDSININFSLDAHDQHTLRSLYPEFALNFNERSYRHPHAFSAAARMCESQLLLLKLGYRCDGLPGVAVKDVGGNFAMHIMRGRRNIHSCCPILGAKDSYRFSSRLSNLRSYRSSRVTAPKIFRELVDEQNLREVFCGRRAQDCGVYCDKLMFLHSTYDMTVQDIVESMDAASASTAAIAVLFDPKCLIMKAGELKEQNCVWNVKDVNGVREIHFSFKNDPSNDYVHRFDSYVALFSTTHCVSERGNLYLFEYSDNRAGTAFLMIQKNFCPFVPSENVSRKLWLGQMNLTRISFYDYTPTYSRKSSPAGKLGVEWIKKEIFVPTPMFNQAKIHCNTISSARFTVDQVMDYIRSLNNRHIYSGTDVVSGTSLSAADFETFSCAIYVMMYRERFRSRQLVKAINDDEQEQRGKCDESIPNVLRKKIMRQIRSSFKADGAIGFMSRMANYMNYPSLFSVEADEAVQYVSVDEVVPEYLSAALDCNREVQDLMREAEPVSEDEVVDTLRRVIHEKLDGWCAGSTDGSVANRSIIDEKCHSIVRQASAASCHAVERVARMQEDKRQLPVAPEFCNADIAGVKKVDGSDGRCCLRALAIGIGRQKELDKLVREMQSIAEYTIVKSLDARIDDELVGTLWGGSLLIHLFAECYSVNVCIHGDFEDHITVPKAYKTIHLLHCGDHYDLLEEVVDAEKHLCIRSSGFNNLKSNDFADTPAKMDGVITALDLRGSSIILLGGAAVVDDTEVRMFTSEVRSRFEVCFSIDTRFHPRPSQEYERANLLKYDFSLYDVVFSDVYSTSKKLCNYVKHIFENSGDESRIVLKFTWSTFDPAYVMDIIGDRYYEIVRTSASRQSSEFFLFVDKSRRRVCRSCLCTVTDTMWRHINDCSACLGKSLAGRIVTVDDGLCIDCPIVAASRRRSSPTVSSASSDGIRSFSPINEDVSSVDSDLCCRDEIDVVTAPIVPGGGDVFISDDMIDLEIQRMRATLECPDSGRVSVIVENSTIGATKDSVFVPPVDTVPSVNVDRINAIIDHVDGVLSGCIDYLARSRSENSVLCSGYSESHEGVSFPDGFLSCEGLDFFWDSEYFFWDGQVVKVWDSEVSVSDDLCDQIELSDDDETMSVSSGDFEGFGESITYSSRVLDRCPEDYDDRSTITPETIESLSLDSSRNETSTHDTTHSCVMVTVGGMEEIEKRDRRVSVASNGDSGVSDEHLIAARDVLNDLLRVVELPHPDDDVSTEVRMSGRVGIHDEHMIAAKDVVGDLLRIVELPHPDDSESIVESAAKSATPCGSDGSEIIIDFDSPTVSITRRKKRRRRRSSPLPECDLVVPDAEDAHIMPVLSLEPDPSPTRVENETVGYPSVLPACSNVPAPVLELPAAVLYNYKGHILNADTATENIKVYFTRCLIEDFVVLPIPGDGACCINALRVAMGYEEGPDLLLCELMNHESYIGVFGETPCVAEEVRGETWGGISLMQLFSNRFRVNICVHVVGRDDDYSILHDNAVKTIHLRYVNDCHFDVLTPVEDVVVPAMSESVASRRDEYEEEYAIPDHCSAIDYVGDYVESEGALSECGDVEHNAFSSSLAFASLEVDMKSKEKEMAALLIKRFAIVPRKFSCNTICCDSIRPEDKHQIDVDMDRLGGTDLETRAVRHVLCRELPEGCSYTQGFDNVVLTILRTFGFSYLVPVMEKYIELYFARFLKDDLKPTNLPEKVIAVFREKGYVKYSEMLAAMDVYQVDSFFKLAVTGGLTAASDVNEAFYQLATNADEFILRVSVWLMYNALESGMTDFFDIHTAIGSAVVTFDMMTMDIDSLPDFDNEDNVSVLYPEEDGSFVPEIRNEVQEVLTGVDNFYQRNDARHWTTRVKDVVLNRKANNEMIVSQAVVTEKSKGRTKRKTIYTDIGDEVVKDVEKIVHPNLLLVPSIGMKTLAAELAVYATFGVKPPVTIPVSTTRVEKRVGDALDAAINKKYVRKYDAANVTTKETKSDVLLPAPRAKTTDRKRFVLEADVDAQKEVFLASSFGGFNMEKAPMFSLYDSRVEQFPEKFLLNFVNVENPSRSLVSGKEINRFVQTEMKPPFSFFRQNESTVICVPVQSRRIIADFRSMLKDFMTYTVGKHLLINLDVDRLLRLFLRDNFFVLTSMLDLLRAYKLSDCGIRINLIYSSDNVGSRLRGYVSKFSGESWQKPVYENHDMYEHWRRSGLNKEGYNPKYFPLTNTDMYARNSMVEQLELWRVHDVIIEKIYSAAYQNLPTVLTSKDKDFLRRSDEEFGLYNVRTGVFEFKPSVTKNYSYGYDGKKFVPLKSSGKSVAYSDRLLVGNSTELMNAKVLYDRCKGFDVASFVTPTIKFFEGVPGCGKTHRILQMVKPRDLVLFPTREGAQDFRRRYAALKKTSVDDDMTDRFRTVHSYLIHGSKRSVVFDRMIVDEALMLHAGEIMLSAMSSGVGEVVLVGDSRQIPYICRLPQCDVPYASIKSFVSDVEHMNISRRCTNTVAALLSAGYAKGMKTTSKVRNEMKLEKFTCIREVVRDPNAKYLVFKQSEKAEMLKHGYDVSTIHEFQGKETKNVVVVRFSARNEDIYKRAEHCLVAISRHRETFVYYTPIFDDGISKYIKTSKNLTDEDYRKAYYPSGGATFVDNSQPVFETRPNDSMFLAGEQIYDATQRLGGLWHTGLEVPTQIVGTKPIFSISGASWRQSPGCMDITHIQDAYDWLLPGNSLHDLKHDVLNVNVVYPLELHLDNVMLKTSHSFNYRKPNFDKMRPSLRTSMPTSRPNTQVETLLAMVKRNLNVPDLMGVTDIPALADSMFDAFVGTYIGDKSLASGFERMPILPNPRSLSEWLVTQPPNVVDQISCDLPLHERRLDRYDFMIKSTVKPQLDTNAPYVYSALQTIAYQTKDINAIFCPIFKEMKKRLLSVLGKRFRIYCDVSPEEFAEDLTNSFQPGDEFAFFSGDDSLIRDAVGRYLEIDFSKYDKSQGLLALLLDLKVMKFLGVPHEYLELWRLSHEHTMLTDRRNGVSLRVDYQRKSGDASTFLGNTIYGMAVVAVLFDLKGKFVIDRDRNRECALLFNLESKFLRNFKYAYFCSKFLLYIDNRFFFLPDPLKLMTKLGRHDLVNRDHVEEYRVSLVDLTRCYSNAIINGQLSEAVAERYNRPYRDLSYAFASLYNIINDEMTFHSLFFSLDTDELCEDPSRPNSDFSDTQKIQRNKMVEKYSKFVVREGKTKLIVFCCDGAVDLPEDGGEIVFTHDYTRLALARDCVIFVPTRRKFERVFPGRDFDEFCRIVRAKRKESLVSYTDRAAQDIRLLKTLLEMWCAPAVSCKSFDDFPFASLQVSVFPRSYENVVDRPSFDEIPSGLELAIYAYPGAGKTMWHCGELFDTDCVKSWVQKPQVVVTNFPQIAEKAKRVIAILPSRSTFKKRVSPKCSDFSHEWYDGIKKYLKSRSNVYLIESDDYIANIRSLKAIESVIFESRSFRGN